MPHTVGPGWLRRRAVFELVSQAATTHVGGDGRPAWTNHGYQGYAGIEGMTERLLVVLAWLQFIDVPEDRVMSENLR